LIPYGKQWIDQQDLQAVSDALQSDFLTTGPRVQQFEEAFAEAVGAKHAVAVCNATAALHLAMLVAGVGDKDRVVTSPNTFLASANAAAFVGATPDFSDIDPVTFNLCPQQLADNWQSDTKAVVAVDYAGQTADMPAIASAARRHGAIVIEDGCHGVGGQFTHDGRLYRVGGHPYADMTTFSFHPVKTMTTGEGGILVTDNDDYAKRARLLRTHGMVRQNDSFTGLGSEDLSEQGPWYYEMQSLGWNYRITDFQCALGLSQLSRLPGFIARRTEIVREYNESLTGLPFLTTPGLREPADADQISWHLYTVQIDFDTLGMTRTEVMLWLRERVIGSQVLYIPVHLQPWYRQTYGYQPGKCPVAEGYYRRTLSLPLYPRMSNTDVQQVIDAMHELLADKS